MGIPRWLLFTCVAVALPVFGYLGAWKSHQCYTCLFFWGSFVAGVCNIVAIVHFITSYNFFKYVAQNCDPSHFGSRTYDHRCPNERTWHRLCHHKNMDECHDKISKLLHHYHTAMHWGVFLLFVSFILHCLGFIWGKELHAELKLGGTLHN